MSTPLSRVRVRVSGVLQADVYDTWDYVRVFGQAEAWAGFYKGTKVVTALLPGQVEGQLGSVRTTAIGGASFVEQLDALDNESFIMKYKIVDHPSNTNPFPGSLFDFKATIRLCDVTRARATFMEWIGEFETSPQEYGIMQKAVADLFEAGFQGLEHCLQAVSGFAAAEPPQMPPPMVHGHHLSDLSRNLGSMSLRPGGSHAADLEASAGASSFQHHRSYVGPASVVSEPAHQANLQSVNESESASSLESSPHIPDRPPGGFHHQWTSGGSGHVLPQFRQRPSVEDDTRAHRRLHRGRSSIREQDPRLADNSSHAPHQGQGSRHSASSLESIPVYQGDPSRQGPLREDLSLGSAVSEAGVQVNPPTAPRDPVLQDREDFKHTLLRNNMTTIDSFRTHSDAGQRRRRTLERERSNAPSMDRASEQRMEVDVSMHAAGPHPGLAQTGLEDELDNLDWARSKQQREIEAREAFQRKARHMGAFSQAAAPGGPFAAAAAIPRALPRHPSQHSLASIGEVETSEGGTRHTTPKGGRQSSQPLDPWMLRPGLTLQARMLQDFD